MVPIRKIVSDISSLKIQGAENIAIASAKAIKSIAQRSYTRSRQDFLKELNDAKVLLSRSRPTEPCLRNALNFIFHDLDSLYPGNIRSVQDKVIYNSQLVLKHFSDSDKIIADIASKKIRDGTIIYTHCHSSTVIRILKKAKTDKKRFQVLCTETRPRFQGRTTAKDLALLKIPVTLFVDSSMRLAIKQADLAFIGADAITAEGKVINKIGSEVAALLCNKYDIPFYSCTNSWKFDPKTVFGFEEEIEQRSSKEVWDKAPKGVKISNFAFEIIAPNLVTGVVSELGIYNPEIFVEEIERNYPWMLK